MSFWKNNSHSPSWSEMLSQAWNKTPPRLLETLATRRPVPKGGWFITQADESHAKLLSGFWNKWFSISKACKCVVPSEHIEKQLRTGSWQIYMSIRSDTGELIGTAVRRWIPKVHVRDAKWAKAGGVDYFCVHPAWRGKEVGRALLSVVHNTAPRPIAPHFIFWEGLMPTIPPLSCGLLYARRCQQGSAIQIADEGEKQTVWRALIHGADIWSETPGSEISLWKTAKGNVAIWNTFHRTVPEGKEIGIVLGAECSEAVNLIGAPWGVLLSDSSHGEGWSMDSPFQWIAYNLGVGFISLRFPALGF
jgi:hypothetical protein